MLIMEKKQTVLSALRLEKIVFDRIEFRRLGFASEKDFEVEIESNIAQRQGTDLYRITLTLKGNKPEEYDLEISLTGYFQIEPDETINEDLKNKLVTKNAVAILMPYLRSEVSLLTAQPGMDCVVLPAFNVNKMLADK